MLAVASPVTFQSSVEICFSLQVIATTYSDRDWVHLLSARCAGWTGWPTSSRSFSVTILVRDVTTRGLGLLESVVDSSRRRRK